VSISAQAALDPQSCDRTLGYAVSNVIYGTGEAVAQYDCEWSFDDGGTASGCAGSHTFASSGFHGASVIVTDASSGANTVASTPEVPVYDALAIDVVAVAPSCGLVFDLTTTKTGGFGGGMYFVAVEPWQDVVTPDPLPASGTIEVASAGTYSITVYREEEANNALCTATATADVTVTECP
jgi:uncharacterized protein CbrC (UPF0167 family)